MSIRRAFNFDSHSRDSSNLFLNCSRACCLSGSRFPSIAGDGQEMRNQMRTVSRFTRQRRRKWAKNFVIFAAADSRFAGSVAKLMFNFDVVNAASLRRYRETTRRGKGRLNKKKGGRSSEESRLRLTRITLAYRKPFSGQSRGDVGRQIWLGRTPVLGDLQSVTVVFGGVCFVPHLHSC